MRFNCFLHLIAFSGKAHRGSPASGGVTTKMLDAGAPSQAKRTPDFGRYLPLSGGGTDKLAGGRTHPAAAGRHALFSAYVGLSKAKRPYLHQRRATDSLLYSNCRVSGVIYKIFMRIISVEFWIRRKLLPGNAGHGLNPATRPARVPLRAPGAEGN